MSTTDDALDLLAGLTLEDGRLWGDAATEEQLENARTVLDPDGPPYGFLTRARGYSKTTDLAAIAIVAMLRLLQPGSRLYALAADKDQGRLLVDAVAGFAARTPALAHQITVNAYTVRSANGSVLEVLPADAAGAYGLLPAFLIVDELAQWASTTSPRKLWEATTSAMAKVPGARLVVLTSAGDPAHWSHKILEHARSDPLWWTRELAGPPPWADPERLEEQRRRLPASSYARLFLNQWTASEDRLTNLDDVRACVTLDGPLDWAEGNQYVLSLDLGVRHDRSIAALMHSERMTEPGGRDVVQRMVLDRMEVWAGTRANPVDLGAVEQWVEYTARAYRARVVCDPWQAIAMVQRLRSRGLSVEEFTFSQQSVGRLAVGLHTTIRDHRLAIPDDPELIDELVNVRLRETSPNVYRLDHDPDRHDDRAVTLAMGIQTLATVPRPGGPIILTDEDVARERLIDARRDGLIPEPVPVIEGRAFGGDTAMPADIHRSDEDEEIAAKRGTAPSPFV